MNVTAESQGRLQVSRIYETTNDAGVRDMLAFMLARDTMHQNQWLAAIQDLEKEGLEMTPCPSNFPQKLEDQRVNYQYFQQSNLGPRASQSKLGSWASGPSPDGKGTFQSVVPPPMGEEVNLAPADPRLWGTPKDPAQAAAGAAKAGK